MKKTVVITGASRGIGRAIAVEFAKNGYNLALICRKSKDKQHMLAKELEEKYQSQVLEFVGDAGDYSFMEESIKQVKEAFGKIDVLINNAGISYIGTLDDMSITDWDNIISTNLTSVFIGSKLVYPIMVANHSGKIINISSVWGNAGASCEVAYSATKGGINAFTKALGKELAPSNVQVNAIACGVIDTEMNSCFSEEEKQELADEIPASRFGKPEEVAALAYSIASGNDYLTAQVITLDGGWM